MSSLECRKALRGCWLNQYWPGWLVRGPVRGSTAAASSATLIFAVSLPWKMNWSWCHNAVSNHLLLWIHRPSRNQSHCHPQLGESPLLWRWEREATVACDKVYSVLGLLMVGTYNFGLDRQRLYERQMHGWPTNSNPSFHGVVDTRELSLSVPQAIDGPITAYKDDLADYEEEDEEIVENSPGGMFSLSSTATDCRTSIFRSRQGFGKLPEKETWAQYNRLEDLSKTISPFQGWRW